MSAQEEGWIGRAVGSMIRRSLTKTFRNIYWIPPQHSVCAPAILFANHHGWHDGYLMYILVKKLGLRSLDWITEFDSFPHFAKVGGLPFPRDQAQVRSATIKKTIRLMKVEKRSLILFPEQHLHYPPTILPFGRSLEFVAKQVPETTVLPVAIRYIHSVHERPEAFIMVGEHCGEPSVNGNSARESLVQLLDSLDAEIMNSRSNFQLLHEGTRSINERLDWRKFSKK